MTIQYARGYSIGSLLNITHGYTGPTFVDPGSKVPLPDREYLSIAYDRVHKPEKSHDICVKAHPDWKACHCDLQEEGVKCTGGPAKLATKN